MFNFKRYNLKNYSKFLLVVVIIVGVIGAFLIKTVQAEDENLFKKQIMGIILGLLVCIFISFIDYHFITRFMWAIYIFNILFLLSVKFFDPINNVNRWIVLKGITIQPSELSKIFIIIFLAEFYTILKDAMNKFSTAIISGILIAIPVLLIYKQPDLSTSLVILFIFLIMLYAAGFAYKLIVPSLLVFIPLFIAFVWYAQQPFAKIPFLNEYQQNRIFAFFNPELEVSEDTLYQQINSVQAIGSGGLYGNLFGNADISNTSLDYVYASESDFIYAVIGSKVGFIGGCVIILLLSIIVFKCLIIAKKAKDYTGMLIATGVSGMLMFQIFVNIGVATSLLPNTGLPLPFISYGLSSLISYMMGIGLVLNISMQNK